MTKREPEDGGELVDVVGVAELGVEEVFGRRRGEGEGGGRAGGGKQGRLVGLEKVHEQGVLRRSGLGKSVGEKQPWRRQTCDARCSYQAKKKEQTG